ncbi:ubiquitin thiolesterase-like protein [Corynascus similis CBS 632.67]
MARVRISSDPTKETISENGDAASSLPLRRSGRARKRPSSHGEDADYENGRIATSSASSESQQNRKRRVAPSGFDVPDNLLETSLGPWKENEQSEWPSWIELESDPAFFTAILGLLGVKGARIEEVLSVDEDTLATLPPPVHGLVFLYEYVADEGIKTTESCRNVWFANQTTQNACATIALLNIIMNAEKLSLGGKLRKFKEESKDLSPPLRGHLINNSTWIRVAHNSFARRLDHLDAALGLQNEVDNKKKRAKSMSSGQQQKRRKPKKGKSEDTSAYHFIAFVPIGQQVWQLDGLASAPVCIGKSPSCVYTEDMHWTSVMCPVLQERMMRYETERLFFSLLAVCGDNLAHVRQRLAANIRNLADINSKFSNSPSWPHRTVSQDTIYDPLDARLATLQLDVEDIQAVPDSDLKPWLSKQQQRDVSSSSDIDDESIFAETTIETALELWDQLSVEQKQILAEYDRESVADGGQESTAMLGRTRDYTAAVHEWVKKLAGHKVLKRLHQEVQFQNS